MPALRWRARLLTWIGQKRFSRFTLQRQFSTVCLIGSIDPSVFWTEDEPIRSRPRWQVRVGLLPRIPGAAAPCGFESRRLRSEVLTAGTLFEWPRAAHSEKPD